ncbi:3-deoxy-manno-octulosonate cytidylyltransferase [Megalodesulfovibrio gigas]|uniref:3-deoxy-manno-octulosonate cytidylyltransferase n=1 Tax=Megalodesulfovibrio gigas (strain ATCC 19364 / DSM 1382 / NCIMB 9332 / VKM B-1759) TaxID=1121448 RepID=T2GG69_MEGG1|nr:3-deoxy-manno-octulosonate cytidylyltransferase [Megalodesulfovibrio gigas]AGW15224.1 3-deoxy-D-manno-octulosonate cytidylyltransferase [Megalodesulfovibrio gigas DSM 1382 = ATCC 19364]
MRALCVIPARYGSTRLPAKPLADILGKPMIQHVYERAARATRLHGVVVATDDQRIMDVVAAFGGQAIMTSPDHASGTERIAEVAGRMEADIYVNVQGDEPLVRPADVDLLVELMESRPDRLVGSLCHPMDDMADLDNPNAVKLVLTHSNDAMYFSRAGIPYLRSPGAPHFKHMGLYAYRREFLSRYQTLPASPLAQSEQLEQLRFLQAGIPIVMDFTDPMPGPAVDTAEDLDRVREVMAREGTTIHKKS